MMTEIRGKRILVGYFQDEVAYQGPTVALLRFLEAKHPGIAIDLVDFTKQTNSSSFTQTAKLFRLVHPVNEFVRRSLSTKWVEVKKSTDVEFPLPDIKHAVLADLYSSMKVDPIPKSLVAKLLRRKYASRARSVFITSKHLLFEGGYRFAYILNSRHSPNAAFAAACDEHDLEIYFWESSNDFNSVIISDKPIHDFFARREKARVLESISGQYDFTKASLAYEQRIANKGEHKFNHKWNSSKTMAYLSKLEHYNTKITYFSSSSDEYMSLGQLSPPRIWKNQFEALQHLDLDFEENRIGLTIRMHPNTLNKSPRYCLRETKRILELHKSISNINVVWPQERVDTYELLKKSDLVLSTGSTTALEAMYMGVPTYHLDHSYNFHASTETMLKSKVNLGLLQNQELRDARRQLALIEMQLTLEGGVVMVRDEDKATGWNRLLSLFAYRDFYRIWNVAREPIWRRINITLFSGGKLLLFLKSSSSKHTIRKNSDAERTSA